jgi:hypothetical protein
MALRKGERKGKWILATIGAWIAAEFLGMFLGIILFGADNMIGILLIGIMSAIGGYLIVQAQLEKIPDDFDDDINRMGQ